MAPSGSSTAAAQHTKVRADSAPATLHMGGQAWPGTKPQSEHDMGAARFKMRLYALPSPSMPAD